MSFLKNEFSSDKDYAFSFSQNDWRFIHDISDRFLERIPSIANRFKLLSACSKENREGVALEMLKHEPRQGLVQRGFESNEVASIYEHSRQMSILLGRLKREDPDLRFQFPKNSSRKILCHDFGEAATTDFTPQDLNRIMSDEKIRIEDLAMRLIFENSPDRYMAYLEYKEKASDYDRLIKVIDVLELIEDITKMGVNNDIMSEIRDSSIKILAKYPDIYQVLKIS